MHCIPKTLGADIEVLNTYICRGHSSHQGAASRLWRELDTISAFGAVCTDKTEKGDESEWGRRWLCSGCCVYTDMGHAELAGGECASARRHAATHHGTLRVLRTCRRKAQSRLAAGDELFVSAHVADGSRESSWGAHLNVQVTRSLWNSLFRLRPHYQALMASFVAASVPLFGQGYVLPDSRGAYRFVMSAQAHHLGEVAGLPTTIPYRRNLLNSRDEPHAHDQAARLHLIAFDTNLQPASLIVRSGLAQLIAAAMELGWYDHQLVLDDPVTAVHDWSDSFDVDVGLPRNVQAARIHGPPISLIEWHTHFIDELRPMVADGRIPEEIVPDGAEILDRHAQIVSALAGGDSNALAARLDWALKWQLIAEEQCRADCTDESMRMVDQLYSHVDDRIGLFWLFWRQGLVDRCGVDDRLIGECMLAGDPRTRSGLRGELVRRLGRWITAIDWNFIELSPGPDAWWTSPEKYRLSLPDPSAPSEPLVSWLRQQFVTDEELLTWIVGTAQCAPLTRNSSSNTFS